MRVAERIDWARRHGVLGKMVRSGVPSAAELVFRNDLPDGVLAPWTEVGYRVVLNRVRLAVRPTSRKTAEMAGPPVRFAVPGDAEDIRGLLTGSFKPYISDLPEPGELEEWIGAQRVMVVRGIGELEGALHFSTDRGGISVNHLVTAPASRRRGVAARLLGELLLHGENRRIRVWVNADNTPALALYVRFGFLPDGVKMVVMTRKEAEEI